MRRHSLRFEQFVVESRHYHDMDRQGQRLNLIVTVQAKAQLEQLARHYGVTQREFLARVLADAEQGVVNALGRGDEEAEYQSFE